MQPGTETRVQTLKRLQALYGVLTDMHGMALEQAAAGVREAEGGIEAQRAMARQSSAVSLAALAAGNKTGWMIYEKQRVFTERAAMELLALRAEREHAFAAAAEVYRENRLQLEQMRSVLREIQTRREREQARREQRESDDRFLSRRRWLEQRELSA
jgi:hypothetical protein